MRVGITINGQRHAVDVPPQRSLAELLRDGLGMTGTKTACGEGTCGSCTVLMDGRPVLSCLTLAVACEGAEVRTVEANDALLDRLRASFVARDGLQCGFCTPGQLMSALALLERTPSPTREQIVASMSGNLCRCGAYEGIVEAVQLAADTEEAA